MCQCQILVMFAVVESFIHMWRAINAVETGKAGFWRHIHDVDEQVNLDS